MAPFSTMYRVITASAYPAAASTPSAVRAVSVESQTPLKAYAIACFTPWEACPRFHLATPPRTPTRSGCKGDLARKSQIHSKSAYVHWLLVVSAGLALAHLPFVLELPECIRPGVLRFFLEPSDLLPNITRSPSTPRLAPPRSSPRWVAAGDDEKGINRLDRPRNSRQLDEGLAASRNGDAGATAGTTRRSRTDTCAEVINQQSIGISVHERCCAKLSQRHGLHLART